jgi:hypothetical protein
VALERRMTAATAATAAVNLVCLYKEWLCYVLGRLHSSYIDFLIFLFFMLKVISSENFSFQSYQNKNP